MHATSRIESPAPRRALPPPLGAGGEPLRVVAGKPGRLVGAAAPGTAAVGALAQPAGPVIVAPTSAGDPLAPALRQGPPYVLAQFDPADYVLHRPRLGDGTVDTVTAAVSLAAGRAVARGLAPVVLGGDHTVALGGVTGVRRGLQGRCAAPVPLFLLWLDAHPDVNTAETSPSGHLHGMVLAGLLGAGPLAVTDPLPPQRVVLAGARAIDPGEAAFLEARPQLERWDVSRLRGRGWVAPLGRLLERVRRAGGRLYVSLDLDVFDPTVAPGVAVPAPGGALADPVLDLLRRVRASGLLAGADVVELYPPSDRERQTARLAARALAALGGAAAWGDVLRGTGAA